jgi:hypothetical protein
MNEIVSYDVFKWILTILTGGLAGTWVFYDSFNLIRIRKADRTDPLVRDKIFGYICGIAVGVIGVVGCLRFHDVM